MADAIASKILRDIEECSLCYDSKRKFPHKLSISMLSIRSSVSSLISQNKLKEKQILLVVEKSLQFFFTLIDNQDHSSRAHSEECLDMIFQSLLQSFNIKLALSCCIQHMKEGKKAPRAAATALSRFAIFFPYVNRDELDNVVNDVFPIFSKLVTTADDIIQQAIIQNCNTIFDVIRETMWNKNLIQHSEDLLNSALLNITKKGSFTRASTLLIERLCILYKHIFDKCLIICYESLMNYSSIPNDVLIGRLHIFKALWGILIEENTVLPETDHFGTLSIVDFVAQIVLCILNILRENQAEVIVLGLEILEKVSQWKKISIYLFKGNENHPCFRNCRGIIKNDSAQESQEDHSKYEKNERCDTIIDPLIFPDEYDELNDSIERKNQEHSIHKLPQDIDSIDKICYLEDESEILLVQYVAAVLSKQFLLRGLHGFAKDTDVRVSHKILAMKCLTAIANVSDLGRLSVLFDGFKQNLGELRSFLQHIDDQMFSATFVFLITLDIRHPGKFVDSTYISQALNNTSAIREKEAIKALILLHNNLEDADCFQNIIQYSLEKTYNGSLQLAITCMDFLTQLNWKNISRFSSSIDTVQKSIMNQCFGLLFGNNSLVLSNADRWLESLVNNFDFSFVTHPDDTLDINEFSFPSKNNSIVCNLSSNFDEEKRASSSQVIEKNLEVVVSACFSAYSSSLDQESFAFVLEVLCRKYSPSLYTSGWNINKFNYDIDNDYLSIVLELTEKYAKTSSALSSLVSVLSSLCAAEFLHKTTNLQHGSSSFLQPQWFMRFFKILIQIMKLYYNLITRTESQENSQNVTNSKFSPLATRKIISSLTEKSRSKLDNDFVDADDFEGCTLSANLFDGLKGAMHNYEISVSPERKTKFVNLLVQTIEATNVILEMIEYSELDCYLDEVLQYLKVFLKMVPEETISCLHQIFKVVFKKNMANIYQGELSMEIRIFGKHLFENYSWFDDHAELSTILKRMLGWLLFHDGVKKEQNIPRKQVVKVLSKLEYFVTKLRFINQSYFSIPFKKSVLKLFTELTRVGLIYQDIDPKLTFLQSVTKQCRKKKPSFWEVSREMIQYLIVMSHVPQASFKSEDLENLGLYLLQEASSTNIHYALRNAKEIVLYATIVLKRNCKQIFAELIERGLEFCKYSKQSLFEMFIIFLHETTVEESFVEKIIEFYVNDQATYCDFNAVFTAARLYRLKHFQSEIMRKKFITALYHLEDTKKLGSFDITHALHITFIFLLNTFENLDNQILESLARTSITILERSVEVFDMKPNKSMKEVQFFLQFLILRIKNDENFNQMLSHMRSIFNSTTMIQKAIKCKNSAFYSQILEFIQLMDEQKSIDRLIPNNSKTWMWEYLQIDDIEKKFASLQPGNEKKTVQLTSELFYHTVFDKRKCSTTSMSHAFFSLDFDLRLNILKSMTNDCSATIFHTICTLIYDRMMRNEENQTILSKIQGSAQKFIDEASSYCDLSFEEKDTERILHHIKFASSVNSLIEKKYVASNKKYSISEIKTLLQTIASILENKNIDEIDIISNFFNFFWKDNSYIQLDSQNSLGNIQELLDISLQIDKYLDDITSCCTLTLSKSVEVKCQLFQSHEEYSNSLPELCRELFLITQAIEYKSHLAMFSQKLEHRNMAKLVKNFHQHPLLHKFAIASRQAILNDWIVQIQLRPPNCVKVPLVSIHQLVCQQTLEDFILRINRLGWITRQQFEEYWISFFGILSLTPTGSEVNDNNIDQIKISCEAIEMLTEMLLTVCSAKNILKVKPHTDVNPESEKFKQWYNEAVSSLDKKENSIFDNNMNLFQKKKFIDTNSDSLDISSSLRALFENFSHWFGKGYDNLPSYLLQQTIFSIGQLIEIYEDLQFSLFSHVHMRNIEQTGFFTPYMGYAQFAILHSIHSQNEEMLEKDTKTEISAQVITWIRKGLSSEWSSIRVQTLNGIISLLLLGFREDFKPVYSFICLTLEKSLSSRLNDILQDCQLYGEEDIFEDGSPDVELMWSTLLHLLEKGNLIDERKSSAFLIISKTIKSNKPYPLWLYRTLVNSILAHLNRCTVYWSFFSDLILECFQHYGKLYWILKHVLRIFSFQLLNDKNTKNKTFYTKITDELVSIYKKCEPEDAIIISSVLPFILLQQSNIDSALALLLDLLSNNNIELNLLTVEMIWKICDQTDEPITNMLEQYKAKAAILKTWTGDSNMAARILLPFSPKYRNRLGFLSNDDILTEDDFQCIEENI